MGPPRSQVCELRLQQRWRKIAIAHRTKAMSIIAVRDNIVLFVVDNYKLPSIDHAGSSTLAFTRAGSFADRDDDVGAESSCLSMPNMEYNRNGTIASAGRYLCL